MFLARCIGVSLAVFVILYLTMSLLVSRFWQYGLRWLDSESARFSETLLFVVRTLPLSASALITLSFTVPSFLMLEPRATDEEIGIAPVVLGLACLGLLAWGVSRAIATQLRTSRTVNEWLSGATALRAGTTVPVYRTCPSAPALTVAGLGSPRVLVSETACTLLTAHELTTALRHEMAHVSSHDNWKKLIFRFLDFPGMSSLESAWSEKAEMAADDAAVSSFDDALDLASALIKLSRLAPVQNPAVLTTGLLQNSPDAVSMRVKRLFQWNQPNRTKRQGARWILLLPVFATMVTTLALNYGSVLVQMHELTEFLVR
jgi:Zn-dependent protease with chaperone function